MLVTNVKRALLSQFNAQNQINPPVKMEDVDFLVPEIWLQGECNSRVGIRGALLSNEFGGDQTLYFNRRRIEQDLLGVRIPGKPSDYSRRYQVFKVLREQLGVPLMDSEFLDAPHTGNSFTINVTTTSMAYMPGSSVTLEFMG
jgi:hypothetical protein